MELESHPFKLKQRQARDDMSADLSTPATIRTSNALSSVLPIAPICFTVFFIIIANSFFIGFRVFLPYPISLWEAGLVTDAWRMLQGDPIYVYGTGVDHATIMYGPLTTLILAFIYYFSGPILAVGRLVSAVSGIGTVLLLATIFCRGERLAFAVGVSLLLAANSRTAYYFTETRPDMAAAFVSILSLILFYYGLKSAKATQRTLLIVAASGVLMSAVMIKQTALAFVFAPMIAVVLQGKTCEFAHNIVSATVPIVAGLVTFGAVWYLNHGLWHYMVEVPAQFHVSIPIIFRIAIEFVMSIPLFALALIHWLYTDARNEWRSPQIRWLIAAAACAIPTCLAAYAKDGGALNSLIMSLLCIGGFCTWRSPRLIEHLRDANRPVFLRVVTGMLVSVFLFAHSYPVTGFLSSRSLKDGNGVVDRSKVIEETRSLPGKVVCPDDPTIPLMAKGYAGRTAVFEADEVGWNPSRRQAIDKEIQSADYVIAMRNILMPHGQFTFRTDVGWGTEDDVLIAAGFTKTLFHDNISQVYELWQRTQQSEPLSSR